ncbi:hypothetical protein GYMLUDRAFT_47912 [Collybiopsis luxurians FD-317 M1]|uniref:DUF3835 domain-containing protein n=1 Tax=Collybiopsis luxurians FD-317 M1 TaxID=944289 RepID=A0A0D0BZI9_9AGAR|nr:hypothetical protein GYMLUDRAFT_47912 [Collybiopsis luxurians FD-317 M1]
MAPSSQNSNSNSQEQPNNVQALHSLLQSFGPDAAQNVSPEALQRISDRLSEMMGEEVVRDAFAFRDQPGMRAGTTGSTSTSTSTRNLNEPVVNEEGLPIIDITEREGEVESGEPGSGSGSGSLVQGVDGTQNLSNGTTTLIDEPPLVPLSTLSPSERDLRRRERERILDMLEAEEALEQHREREREARARKEALDKRKEDGKTERERLLALRETHRRMGKALLRSEVRGRGDDGEKEKDPSFDTTREELAGPSSQLTEDKKQKKKSVSFAEPEDDEDDAQQVDGERLTSSTDVAINWGDVARGRLRSTPKSASPMLPRDNERLMKWQVVERVPGGGDLVNPNPSTKPTTPTAPTLTPTPTQKIQFVDAAADSDDESEAGSPPPSDDEDDHVGQDSDTEHSDPDADPDARVDGAEDEGVDWDYAQHQREIALEYYRKRDRIGKENLAALSSHTHEPDEDSSVSQVSPPSRSKAVLRWDSDPSSSRSLDSSTIIPAANVQRTLQSSIRYGKLDEGGRLVGGEEASDSGSDPDDEEVARGIIELLQKGQVYNIGPGEGSETKMVTVPPAASASPGASTTTTTITTSTNPTQTSTQPPPHSSAFTTPREPLPQKPKTSRFKLAKTQSERTNTTSITPGAVAADSLSVPRSDSSTPVSAVGRSSPKVTSALESSVVERTVPTPTPKSSLPVPSPLPSPLPSSSSSKQQLPPGISSFSGPTPQPTIVESPSFPQNALRSQRRPERPPMIMSSKVVESSSLSSRSQAGKGNEEREREREGQDQSEEVKPQKRVSRFKAERS